MSPALALSTFFAGIIAIAQKCGTMDTQSEIPLRFRTERIELENVNKFVKAASADDNFLRVNRETG